VAHGLQRLGLDAAEQDILRAMPAFERGEQGMMTPGEVIAFRLDGIIESLDGFRQSFVRQVVQIGDQEKS
jgi:hypothetical protein